MAHWLGNLELIEKTGYAPGLGPVRSKAIACMLEENIKRELRVKDLQQFLKRFDWQKSLPDMAENDAERMLYYRGQLMLFYMDNVNDDGSGRFFLLPYALDGEIDVIGRYIDVTPVPFANGKASEDGKEKPWIQGLKRRVIYDLDQWNRIQDKDITKYCVLLKDYSNQLAQYIVPRSVLQEGLIGYQSEILPIMRTSLINSAGVTGMRVNSQDEESNVKVANAAKVAAAKNGEGWIPIVGAMEFQDLNTASSNSPTDLLEAYQAIDNCRAAFMGSGSGTVFQKNAHMLQDEQDGNNQSVQVPLQDSLDNRKNFAELANAVFAEKGINIMVDINKGLEMPENEEIQEDEGMIIEEGGEENE